MPRSSNYYDALLEQLMVPGGGWSDRQYNRGMQQQASEMEDERLRGLLGSKRKRRRGDQTPEGSYTAVFDPRTMLATERARMGLRHNPYGTVDIRSGDDPRFMQEQEHWRRWAEQQRSVWGR